MRLLGLLLAILLIAAPASAQSLNNVFDIYASGATSFPVIAANGSITSAPITVAQAQRIGLSWYLVPASGNPSVNVIILQANNSNDTLSQWSNPVT